MFCRLQYVLFASIRFQPYLAQIFKFLYKWSWTSDSLMTLCRVLLYMICHLMDSLMCILLEFSKLYFLGCFSFSVYESCNFLRCNYPSTYFFLKKFLFISFYFCRIKSVVSRLFYSRRHGLVLVTGGFHCRFCCDTGSAGTPGFSSCGSQALHCLRAQ